MYKRILLIDDDRDDQELFLIALHRMEGHTLWATADHGLDALKKLSAAATPPDLIFVDLNMPMMTGQEFLKAIKATPELKDIPVVVHTTTTDPRTVDEVRGLGAFKFFSKPVKFDDLLRLLPPVLDGSYADFVVK